MLRKYIRQILSEGMCPIRGASYGGIPSSGNFLTHKEYTVAASNYFEAAHCILGSLGRRVGAPGQTEWHSMVAGEKGHLLEEIGIMLKVVGEYKKEIYVRQLNDLSDYKEEYREQVAQTNQNMIDDIREKSPALIALAEQNSKMLDDVKLKEPEFPDSVYKVGKLTYEAIQVVAQNLLNSTQNWDEDKIVLQADNAWAQRSTSAVTNRLNDAIQDMIKDLGPSKPDHVSSDDDDLIDSIMKDLFEDVTLSTLSISSPYDLDPDLKSKHKAFMKEYHRIAPQSPLHPRQRYWYMGESEESDRPCIVITEIGPWDGLMHLASIQTSPRGECEAKGYASKIMNVIVEIADETGVALSLDPSPFGSERLGVKDLEAWYSKVGFKPDDERGGEWVRQPKK